MKNTFFLLTLSLILLGCFSTRQLNRSHKLLQTQVDSLQQMGAYWENLSPWDDEYEVIDSMLMVFPEMLEKVLKNPAIAQYRMDTLAFFNAQSDDGRITCFNWEEKMGGTYQPFTTLIRYQNPDDSTIITYLGGEIYVEGIYDLEAKNGETLYLVIGSGKGCTTCIFARAYLLQITHDSLEYIFTESGDFRYMEETLFDYNEETRELDILYYDIGCTDDAQDFPDSCIVEAHYFFDGETFVVK